jgi:hypothetical protein
VTMVSESLAPENFEARVAEVMQLPLAERHDALDALYQELQAFLEAPTDS